MRSDINFMEIHGKFDTCESATTLKNCAIKLHEKKKIFELIWSDLIFVAVIS